MLRSLTRQGEGPGEDASTLLDVLAQDIRSRPDRLTSLPDGLREQIQQLTKAVPVDHDEPLDGAAEL